MCCSPIDVSVGLLVSAAITISVPRRPSGLCESSSDVSVRFSCESASASVCAAVASMPLCERSIEVRHAFFESIWPSARPPRCPAPFHGILSTCSVVLLASAKHMNSVPGPRSRFHPRSSSTSDDCESATESGCAVATDRLLSSSASVRSEPERRSSSHSAVAAPSPSALPPSRSVRSLCSSPAPSATASSSRTPATRPKRLRDRSSSVRCELARSAVASSTPPAGCSRLSARLSTRHAVLSGSSAASGAIPFGPRL